MSEIKSRKKDGACARQSALFRLVGGDDLYKKIKEYGTEYDAFVILTCVGSLSTCTIRLAGARQGYSPTKTIEGPLEIVSLVGTVVKGSPHLHISVADVGGHVMGGHLMEGSKILTTAEVAITECGAGWGLEISREDDPATGYRELVVKKL